MRVVDRQAVTLSLSNHKGDTMFTRSLSKIESRRNVARRGLCVESLEDRRVLANFFVTSLDDAGDGTLRQAIEDANSNPGADSIEFQIPGDGPYVIDPLSELPRIVDPLNVNGGGLVEINGGLAGAGVDGLVVSASGTTIRGLSITGFSGHGISTSDPFVDSLGDVDDMVSGLLPSVSVSGTIDQADLYDSGEAGGSWAFDNPIPGGGGDDYGIVATGTLNVNVDGTYSFAIGNDDGARLRIDGLDVIVDDSLHGFQNSFNTIDLNAGSHTFEWVGFERGGEAGFELSVAVGEAFGDQFIPLDPFEGWKVVGDPAPNPEIALTGTIDVTAYYFAPERLRDLVIADNLISENGVNGVNIEQPRTLVEQLSDVDEMVSGAQPSESYVGKIRQADLADQKLSDSWDFDNPIPGGGGDDYGIVATGVLNVTVAGIYSFALGNDDGARLRVNGADVIVDDALHPFTNSFGSLARGVGPHSFEWVGFERGGGSAFELSVAVGDVTGDPLSPLDPGVWKVVGDPKPAEEIALQGVIEINAYYRNPTAPDDIQITSNLIAANLDSGVNLEQVQGTSVVSNDLSWNGFSGATLSNSANNRLVGNTADGNGVIGVYLNTCDENTVIGNTAIGHGFAGIGMIFSNSNSFTGNFASENFIGIWTPQGNANVLTGNTASQNFRGFAAGNVQGYTFKGNAAIENIGDGFRLGNSQNNTYQGNSAIGNGENGFWLFGSSLNNLRGNRAVGNGLAGFS